MFTLYFCYTRIHFNLLFSLWKNKRGLRDHLPACVPSHRRPLLGNGSVKTFPRQRIQSQQYNRWTRCFLCDPYRMKYSISGGILQYYNPIYAKVSLQVFQLHFVYIITTSCVLTPTHFILLHFATNNWLPGWIIYLSLFPVVLTWSIAHARNA
jgi:hypothetical protein